jgi:signal transduction histidine kinase
LEGRLSPWGDDGGSGTSYLYWVRADAGLSTDEEPIPTFGSLQQARARSKAIGQWLRLGGPNALGLATWIAFNMSPSPGWSGQHLAVSAALGGMLLCGLAATVPAPRENPGRVQLTLVVGLFVTSGALVWLQPGGAGVGGLVLAVAMLTLQMPGRNAVAVSLVTAIWLVVVLVTRQGTAAPSALGDAAIIGAVCGLILVLGRLREANLEAERLLVELERSRAAEARAAELTERQRLAREMHDVLAHSLSGLMLQLEAARMLAAEDANDPRLPKAIDRAHHLGKTGLEEARRAIGMLRDDELPGPERLGELAVQFEEDRGIPCRFTVSGEAHELGSEVRLALYRVAQEALTNIIKHAHPDRVELCLAHEDHRTRLTVEDFATANAGLPLEGEGGYGLTGMRERAELLGGTLTTTTTGRGYRVELLVPA